MRESNHCFPNQNKACVCINSQLYDRRALDTTAPLPLFNSLTHLSYLTSTSPRIREIMTQDGGLERMVRMLHDYCLSPTPPENPAMIYGLTPPNARPPKPSPTLNPASFDKHAAYRFSLAFQCVVNIGVRGSEHIRSRVVQAGTLDVVGCVLEAWLASKGFAVGPSSSATGLPRETREQRQARKLAQIEQRQREEAAQLQRALQRQLQMEQTQQRILRQDVRDARAVEDDDREDDAMDISPSPSQSASSLLDSSSHASTPGANSDTDMSTSTDNSIATTPLGSGTPTGSVVIPIRDRSGTLLARPAWDQEQTPQITVTNPARDARRRARNHENDISPVPSTDTSRPETETEDDGEQDGDVTMDRADRATSLDSASTSPSPERQSHNHNRLPRERRAVGIASNNSPTIPQAMAGALGLNADAHIIINQAGGVTDVGVGVGVDGEVGVEDGLVSLEANDDFAMGAPPGAPGAIAEAPPTHGLTLGLENGRRRNTVDAPDVTPRAGLVSLPGSAESNATMRGTHSQPTQISTPITQQRTATIRGRHNDNVAIANVAGTTPTSGSLGGRTASGTNHHHREVESGPYRDEDVLLGLQLLAYLSKYPHVRQAFYKPRVTFHPASINYTGARYGANSSATASSTPSAREKEKQKEQVSSHPGKESQGFFRAFANAATGGRGKERATASSSQATVVTPIVASSQIRQTNVFSLVERFTFKPSSTETELPNPPPRLPPEIQYWAGVIMRNACRKDESRGGIRQCANMLCGRWESYPREFAKCRRCRKAKYCGKECQSTAWSEGHRFWCSAKDADEDATNDHPHSSHHSSSTANIAINTDGPGNPINVQVAGGGPSRLERRERDRSTRDRGHGHGETDTATVRGYRPPNANSVASSSTATASSSSNARAEGMSRERTLQPSQGRSRASRTSATHAFSAAPNPDPTNNSFLTFPLQSVGQQDTSAIRRRAETITPSSITSMPTEVAPHVIPSRPAPPPLTMPSGFGSSVGGWSIDPLARNIGEPGPSRRGRHMESSPTAYRSPGGEGNDMVLG